MSHAMVINNHESPFIGPIKIDPKNVTNDPPWTMVILLCITSKNVMLTPKIEI